jgi:hypothetical protein
MLADQTKEMLVMSWKAKFADDALPAKDRMAKEI